jgi:hypothetical protein
MTNGARIAYYFGATEFVPDVSGVRVIHVFDISIYK